MAAGKRTVFFFNRPRLQVLTNIYKKSNMSMYLLLAFDLMLKFYADIKKASECAENQGGKMRKVLSLLAAAVVMSAVVSVAFAQFTPVSSVKKTAKVTFVGAGVFTWDVAIKNVSDDADATDITWNAAAITPGSTGWVNAQQYVLITSTITDATSAVQVYTDNMNASSAYKYVHAGTPDTISAGGLVGKNNPSASPLPLAWSMKDVKVAGGATVDPTSSDNTIKFASLYFKDKSNTLNDGSSTPFQNGEHYITILKGGTGWRWGGGVGDIGGSASGTFYMYIGASFSSASTPNEYGTDTLTFEGYTE